jgi:hypothetical protein
VRKPQGRRPLGRPRHRFVDNIKMDLRVMVWDGMDWIDLAEDWDCEHGNVLLGSIICWEVLE